MTEKLLNIIALEYLENDISIKDLASKYHFSKSTLVKYFNGQMQIKLGKFLQEKVNAKKARRFIESKSTYGNQGNTVLSRDEIIYYANFYVDNDYTYDEMVKAINNKGVSITKGTLSNSFTIENLGVELYNKVQQKILINKANAVRDIKK